MNLATILNFEWLCVRAINGPERSRPCPPRREAANEAIVFPISRHAE